MRLLAIAALAACVSSAAYADTNAPGKDACEVASSVNSEEIARAVEAALAQASEAIEHSQMDAALAQRLEASIDAAMARVDARLAEVSARGEAYEMSDADEDAIEARIEEAMARAEAAIEARESQQARIEERVEAAMARAEAAIERAHEVEAERANAVRGGREHSYTPDDGGGRLEGGPKM